MGNPSGRDPEKVGGHVRAVNIVPLPLWARKLPARWRPCHPPIYDGDPTPEQVALAEALVSALDLESRVGMDGSVTTAGAADRICPRKEVRTGFAALFLFVTCNLKDFKCVRTSNAPDYRPRLTAPANLTQGEAKIWRELTRSVSADHFQPSDKPLLTEYARAISLADRAAEALEKGAVADGRPSPWVNIQERAVRAIVALSARLRLAPQSRYDRLRAGVSARTGIDEGTDDDICLLGRLA